MNLEELKTRRDELIGDNEWMDNLIKEKEEELWELKVRGIAASELARSAMQSALRSASIVDTFYLEKLKCYLEKVKVGFTYYQKGEMTYLIFESKNRLLAEKAIKDMLADITKTPEKLEKFSKKVLRKPHEMTPEDKLAYYKTNVVYKGMSPVVTKEIGKERAR